MEYFPAKLQSIYYILYVYDFNDRDIKYTNYDSFLKSMSQCIIAFAILEKHGCIEYRTKYLFHAIIQIIFLFFS